jgi:SAM-dependent methyltransferase
MTPEEPPPFCLEDLRRAYDADASYRDGLDDVQWRAGVIERWLGELPPRPRLLELGPGTGQVAAHAAGLGARVFALDLSVENVARCRRRGIAAEVGDLRAVGEMPALGTFDGVYAINSLLHVPRTEHAAVVAGARQRLEPGGSLLLVSWGGVARDGIWEEDRCEPPRYFSQYDDDAFFALSFDGFDVVRRELLPDTAPDGQHPQLLVLRRSEVRPSRPPASPPR